MHKTWENKLEIFHICLLASELFTAHLLGTSLQTLRLKIVLKKQVKVVIPCLQDLRCDGKHQG